MHKLEENASWHLETMNTMKQILVFSTFSGFGPPSILCHRYFKYLIKLSVLKILKDKYVQQLSDIFKVTIQMNSCMYSSYEICQSVQENLTETELLDCMSYTVQLACNRIKIDLIITQDGGCLVSFAFQYFRNKVCSQKFDNG